MGRVPMSYCIYYKKTAVHRCENEYDVSNVTERQSSCYTHNSNIGAQCRQSEYECDALNARRKQRFYYTDYNGTAFHRREYRYVALSARDRQSSYDTRDTSKVVRHYASACERSDWPNV